MKRYIRKFIKEEKRIIKLIWQKGLFPKEFKVDYLYWAEYRHGNRGRRRRRKYAWSDYLPEVHYCTSDYWGECDEYGFVSMILDRVYWENTNTSNFSGSGEWPESSFKFKGRLWFIKYLEALPTVNRSSKINKILRRNKGD